MDWARVGMLMLRRGELNGRRIVPGAWIDEMVRPSPASSRYGYQIRLGYDDPLLPPEGAGSTGAVATEPFIARDTYMLWGRGQQHVFVSPSRELVIVRLGPALGRAPIRPGFDVPFLVNTAIRGMR
jgi:CubicO group peptidase (beta-lactamase class C family)